MVAFQQLHALTCLQGIVNRDRPRLLLRYMTSKQWASERGFNDLDGWWWHELRQRKLLPAEYNGRVMAIDGQRVGLPVLLRRYTRDVSGLVVWDPRVPATSHLASTLAGTANLLPVTPLTPQAACTANSPKSGSEWWSISRG